MARLGQKIMSVIRDLWPSLRERTSKIDSSRQDSKTQEQNPSQISSLSTFPETPEPDSDFRSHSQVADALIETVTSGDDGLGIALTGRLGSGKSSIVEQTKKRLESGESDSLVFTYDIWVHRGDSIRRSFIEELAQWLEGKGWIGKSTANEAERYVLKQQSESRSQITAIGAAAAILLALLSPALLLTRADRWNVIAEQIPLWLPDLGLDEILVESFGALVALLILTVFTAGLGTLVIWRLFSGDGMWSPSLLSRESSVTIEEADASTVDFRKAFEKLVGSALEDSDRKLVIVIDNLDRFTPEDVYETWTNLQTFFDLSAQNRHDESDEEDWRGQFWTILPFSPKAPYRLRQMLDRPEECRGDENAVALTPSRAPFEEYIEKTFQLRFRVSPPVQSDYEEYFLQQFEQAIEIHDDQGAAGRVRDLFFRFVNDSRKPSGTLQPTPRTVNRYLNDLVGSIRQNGETPPIPVQAYFLLLKRKFGDNLTQHKIQSDSDVDLRGAQPLVGVQVSTLRRQLLMLHHGIKESKVDQILIRSEVRKAIEDGDSGKLEELQGETGFSHIVRERVQQLRARPLGSTIATAAVALEDVDQRHLPEQCWKLLTEGIEAVDEIEVRSKKIGQGLNVLIKKQKGEKGDTELLERMSLRLISAMPE